MIILSPMINILLENPSLLPRLLIIIRTCSEYVIFAILAIVSLNIASIGRNANIIITGTDMEVADIWFLHPTPITAPIIIDAIIPTAMINKKQILSFVDASSNKQTKIAEPTRQAVNI